MTPDRFGGVGLARRVLSARELDDPILDTVWSDEPRAMSPKAGSR